MAFYHVSLSMKNYDSRWSQWSFSFLSLDTVCKMDIAMLSEFSHCRPSSQKCGTCALKSASLSQARPCHRTNGLVWKDAWIAMLMLRRQYQKRLQIVSHLQCSSLARYPRSLVDEMCAFCLYSVMARGLL